MNNEEYIPVAVETIYPEKFPKVAIYLQQGGQYVLYIDEKVGISEKGLKNLVKVGVRYVFVKSSESKTVQAYLDANIENIFAEADASKMEKNRAFCTTLLHYTSNLYADPHDRKIYDNIKRGMQSYRLQINDRFELSDLLRQAEKTGKYLITHSMQVAVLNIAFHNRFFNLDDNTIASIGLGSILHDIGMINVSDHILEKHHALDSEEYHKVKLHTKEGHYIAVDKGVDDNIALDIVLRHHERYDGKGYPGQLEGDAIPQYAQVTAICDIFSALINDRPFRPASKIEEGVEILKTEKEFFNPLFLEQFEELLLR